MSSSAHETIASAFARHQAGDFDAAEALYRTALTEDRHNLNGLHLLGLLRHQRGKTAEAIALLLEAVALLERQGNARADHAALYNNLGNALKTAGREQEAALQYRRGLALDPGLTDLHVNLGNALLTNGDFIGAIAGYKAALRLAPGHTAALMSLACLLIDQGRPDEALTFCGQLAAAAHDDPNAHFLLGRAKAALDDNCGAIDALTHCLKLDPEHAGALLMLGMTLAKTGMSDGALPFLERAAKLRPDDASIHAELGNVLEALGQAEPAQACFRRAAKLRPLVTWPAVRRPAAFSVLLITCPGVANTPPEFLFANAGFDSHFFSLFGDVEDNLDMLRRHGDIVVNLICDADQGRGALSAAAALIDRLGKHTINHPCRVMNTDREAVARLIRGIKQCHVPSITRMTREDLVAPGAAATLRQRGFEFPLLLRVAGTHGGDAFEKVGSEDDIAHYLETYVADVFYVSQYVDYKALDGYFRKYRFVVTKRDILPYHLAIGEDWKVHHYTTCMQCHAWMQDEEKAFLENPSSVFSSAHYGAMAQIRDAIGLDFFGIDCSLDHHNRLLVFEVNASILIHNDNADFPYKTPGCLRIKEALAAMLAEEAAIARSPLPKPLCARHVAVSPLRDILPCSNELSC